jgi:hypothetical protein
MDISTKYCLQELIKLITNTHEGKYTYNYGYNYSRIVEACEEIAKITPTGSEEAASIVVPVMQELFHRFDSRTPEGYAVLQAACLPLGKLGSAAVDTVPMFSRVLRITEDKRLLESYCWVISEMELVPCQAHTYIG